MKARINMFTKAIEQYAANCVWINNNVLVPKGYPVAKAKIKTAGYNVIEVD